MKNLYHLLAFGVFCVPCFLFASPADAQSYGLGYGGRPSRYVPARPKFSPVFDYFRRDVGILDSYHTFVRPQIDLDRRLANQEFQIQRQQSTTRRLGTDVNGIRQSLAAPTGTGSTFFNYSHYYNNSNSSRGR